MNYKYLELYRVGQAVVYLGWVDIDLGYSITRPILLDSLKLGRMCYGLGQDDGTCKSMSTQPRSTTTCPTL